MRDTAVGPGHLGYAPSPAHPPQWVSRGPVHAGGSAPHAPPCPFPPHGAIPWGRDEARGRNDRSHGGPVRAPGPDSSARPCSRPLRPRPCNEEPRNRSISRVGAGCVGCRAFFPHMSLPTEGSCLPQTESRALSAVPAGGALGGGRGTRAGRAEPFWARRLQIKATEDRLKERVRRRGHRGKSPRASPTWGTGGRRRL